MKSRPFVRVFPVLVAVAWVGSGLPLAAQTLLFSDDFGPKPLASWTPSPLGLSTNWSAASGAAVYNGSGHTQLHAGDAAWTDYRFEVAVKLDNGSNYPGGIRGRVDPDTGAGYAAWLYPGSGEVRLYRATAWNIDTSGLTLLGQASIGTITTGVFHELALDFDGDDISVEWNGTPVIAVTDSTLAEGKVALDVSNQPLSFDDAAVTDGSGTLFADDFSPRPLRRWTVSPLGLGGGWDGSAGAAAYDGGGHTQLWAGNPSWTDYTVEAKVRVANAADYPGGIRGRLDTSTGGSYAAWIYPGAGKIKLWRHSVWHIDTSPTTVLAEVNATISTGDFHTLALRFQGSRIEVLFDGVPVIDVTDSTYSAGTVALDVSNQPIDFDDVTVIEPAAPPAAPPAEEIFSDDFASGLAGWTPSPLGLFSHWTGSGGTAAYDGGGHTQIYAGSSTWTDYRLAVKVKLANGSNHPGGIRGRVDTATGQSYAAWLYPADGVVKLFRAAAWDIDTSGLTLLDQANVGTIASGVFHDLAMTFDGDRIQVELDGLTVIDTTDSTLASGAVALDVSNQPVEFDDVTVSAVYEGPGGPVVVLSDAANPFTRYLAEILLAEGLNHYAVREIDDVDAAVLARYDAAVLGQTALTSGQVTMLSDWVTAGGNLIAMRPDVQLAGLLGLTTASGTVAEGYLLIDTGAAPGAGLVDETIQFHGTADRYTLNTLDGTTDVATIYSDATTSTAWPAVTLRAVGSSGGQAAAFTYDLARSVVLTRQGNPAWAGQERDGQAPIRPDDLFYGASSTDPQTDWVNLDKAAIPQADEQQRLLANLILSMTADRRPLPRFWYFPRGEKAVVLMTGDDHGNNGTEGRFEDYQAASPSNCSVADWECVRGTSYIYPGTPLAAVDAEAFEADGFEIAVHVNTGCSNWTESSLDAFYTAQLADFATFFASLAAPATNRTHCIVWSDWVTQAKVAAEKGIRLDTNYYYWPAAWVDDRPGFMTGSGMPMRFADTDGTRIDVYQAATQMTDESGQSFPFTIDTLLDNALGSDGYYGVMTANMHTDSPGSSGSDEIVGSALTRGVPVVSARQLLTWLDGRNGSSFGSIGWSGGVLTFTVTAAAGANGLRAMIPASTSAGDLASLADGSGPVAWTTETIKGIAYAVFPAVSGSGSYTASYEP